MSGNREAPDSASLNFLTFVPVGIVAVVIVKVFAGQDIFPYRIDSVDAPLPPESCQSIQLHPVPTAPAPKYPHGPDKP